MNMQKELNGHQLYDPAREHDSCGVGFVAHIKGRADHEIIEQARTVLVNMTHRGAVGSERTTGDGAGILTALPHRFLEKIMKRDFAVELPRRGGYAAGIVFLPRDYRERTACRRVFEQVVAEEGQQFIGWRPVPRDNSMIGPTARSCEPVMEQAFITGNADDPEAFDRKLFLIRKQAQKRIRGETYDSKGVFYIASLSTRVLVYKGMLMPEQLFAYFPDLSDPDYETHVAMVHSRFSTNTFPSWDRAQPLRYMSHNGEINTLQGNVNKMYAREGTLRSRLFGEELGKAFPIVEPDGSDSGNFDNVLELLLLSGRELPEAVMMMVPEAWQNHQHMEPKRRDVYEYMSCSMEPWDGPASISFTDGKVMGALLDRNGLRPSRYYVTDDDMVIMASEVGVLDIPPERVRLKGRLQPGRMFLVDFEQGRIVDDDELKTAIAERRPYGEWLRRERVLLSELPAAAPPPRQTAEELTARLRMFGYTEEHQRILLQPMAEDGKEPLGSMGNDAPLAVLSQRPRLTYEYFKQLFAQVTNPPIDSIREEMIMSLSAYLGPEANLLETGPAHCRRLRIDHPVLTNEELARLRDLDYRGRRSARIDATFAARPGEESLHRALRRITREAEAAIEAGYAFVILTDRNAGPDRIPVSALLAVGAVHHYLVQRAKRTQVGIILETGEPREVHHFCALVGYGADAVNPYLAYEAMWRLREEGFVSQELDEEEIVSNYRDALAKGMRKVFGKMGISTIDSYRGAQIFEIVGLASNVVERCFAGTASRVEGVGFDTLEEEARRRHRAAYPARNVPVGYDSENPGDYQWRVGGERHMWEPEAVASLQRAAREGDESMYRRFADLENRRTKDQATLRGLLRFREGSPVPLEEVEPAEEIMKRFATGAMSFGSISQEAHETLAVAMNRVGGKSNTGEGGERRERYRPLPGGDSKRSAIKQVASGRFGVTIEYLTEATELQIKMAQGAKPGEGGELPGRKVYDFIADTRYSTPGVGLISPPPHHDIYSIEDLAQLIFDLKNANPDARVSVKLVSEVGVGTVAAGVAKAHADHILISGQDGGTGASPLTGIKYAGVPWELGLAETHQTLVMNNLRSRVVLQTDGQIKTGRDVAIAAMLGAEETGLATGPLITLGCVMMRVCHKNTCPVGIATQDERLRRKFAGKPEHVIAYLRFVAEDLRRVMAELGFRSWEEMVGRSDMLERDDSVLHWKSESVDLSRVLAPAVRGKGNTGVICCIPQEHGIDHVLDRKLIELAEPALARDERVHEELLIRNVDRTTGTMLSHEITRRRGFMSLPEDLIHFRFSGSAGQSFGAWLAKGVTLELEGDANDYLGKGLSGGTIAVYPPSEAGYVPEENIIIGNVALYGAIAGEMFVRGRAAERFCVRNSGAHVVVEGVGDHGLEYMTGGRAVILGPVGRNFAAGMSGGIGYVWDPEEALASLYNPALVVLEELDDEDERTILYLLRRHAELTGSTVGAHVVSTWKERRGEFLRVISPQFREAMKRNADTASEVIHG
ncbi:MAG: glutamate synthase large subunit [Spirochaetaceae bacterium]